MNYPYCPQAYDFYEFPSEKEMIEFFSNLTPTEIIPSEYYEEHKDDKFARWWKGALLFVMK